MTCGTSASRSTRSWRSPRSSPGLSGSVDPRCCSTGRPVRTCHWRSMSSGRRSGWRRRWEPTASTRSAIGSPPCSGRRCRWGSPGCARCSARSRPCVRCHRARSAPPPARTSCSRARTSTCFGCPGCIPGRRTAVSSSTSDSPTPSIPRRANATWACTGCSGTTPRRSACTGRSTRTPTPTTPWLSVVVRSCRSRSRSAAIRR